MLGKANIDIQENYNKCLDTELLNILLKDRSSNKNIIWATDIYANKGTPYDSWEQITINLITGRLGKTIRPRIDKSEKEQKIRIKDKAEVFTPSWICNEMNNYLCDEWFEAKNVFNIPNDKTWKIKKKKIIFKNEKDKTWQDFVKLKILEISCGEAPFLVSRYDTTTGELIEINNRIGALDRKLRVVNENCDNEQDWFQWTLIAFKSIYGYEWQGDNLLIARENLLFTFIDHYITKFNEFPNKEYLIEIATILSWNLWQMDGLKYVIPNSCIQNRKRQLSLFENDEITQCEGCLKNDNSKHIGIYSKIMNWETQKIIKFFKGGKYMKFDFVIGNPPYQNGKQQIYPYFYTESKIVGNCVEMIFPCGWQEPKNANGLKIMNNKLTKEDNQIVFINNVDNVFPNIIGAKHTNIILWKNGYNNQLDGYQKVLFNGKDEKIVKLLCNVSEIELPKILNNILYKIRLMTNKYIDSIIYVQNNLNLETLYQEFPKSINVIGSNGRDKRFERNIFKKISAFTEFKVNESDILTIGTQNNKRVVRYIPEKFVDKTHINLLKYKLIVSAAASKDFGSKLSDFKVLKPREAFTRSFISFGASDSEQEIINISNYLKTKFSRALLYTLKNGLMNNKDTWKNVPLQDFTNNSDIDWTKSIHEIDLQLYKKYGLNQEEIDFIESHVKEMK